jgi:GNAT superfamily N-acetyltransferase
MIGYGRHVRLAGPSTGVESCTYCMRHFARCPGAETSAGVKRPFCDAIAMEIRIDNSLEGIDWEQVKADLAADDFDNGRSAEALRRSFRQSQHVAIARDDDRIVGLARLLSDGVCNAYLLDVWAASAYRRQGIGSSLVRRLRDEVPGHHIGLQTDGARQFYESLGFRPQPEFWSLVVGTWLDNDANR